VLDLCAAPGGKSTHLQSLLSANSLLVSNELIKARAGILKQNIVKWGCNNVIVTANDPQHFQKLAGFLMQLLLTHRAAEVACFVKMKMRSANGARKTCSYAWPSTADTY
jgi:hypothetical protein